MSSTCFDDITDLFVNRNLCVLMLPTAATISVLVSGAVSAISTAIVTSIIVWCVMRRAAQRPSSPADDKGVTTHELASVVIYDTPVIKEHNDQSISTQDNVAYGGTIPLKQNEAYEQVHIN